MVLHSAGIDWTPKFRRAVWKTDAGSTDWHTASNSTCVTADLF